MRIGSRDRRITIQKQVAEKGPAGGVIEVWTDVQTVWARKVDLKGAELFAAAQIVDSETLKFNIRFRDDFDEKARVIYSGKEYYIQRIEEVGRKRELELTVKTP